MPLGDGYCSLTEEQTRRSLDEETRTWHIDETMLDELNDDLQTIVQCTEDGDVLQIRASRTVRPTARVVIPWSLTIGAEPEEVDLRDGVLPKEPKRIVLSCPDDNQGIFLVRCVRPNAPVIASSGVPCTEVDGCSSPISRSRCAHCIRTRGPGSSSRSRGVGRRPWGRSWSCIASASRRITWSTRQPSGHADRLVQRSR